VAKEKCPACPPQGAPDWMVTYGDLMTLLLCFFVLLFSFSELDKIEFRSLKDTFTGAFGVMSGHSITEGLGVTSQPQRYTSALFDEALEKIRKAQSDRYPHEQLEYLNSVLASAEEAFGLLIKEAEKNQISADELQNVMRTVRLKIKEEQARRSQQVEKREGKKLENAKQFDETALPSRSIKNIKMTREKQSTQEAKAELDLKKRKKNLEDQAPDKRILARGNRFSKKRGDASRSKKMAGRNKPLMGNPGDNEIQEGLTGQGLSFQHRMDRVEGKKEKKRFEYPVPDKETSKEDFQNISGRVKSTQADANRAVVDLSEPIPASKIFYPKTDRLKPGAEAEILKFSKILRDSRGGYFQIESHTDKSQPGKGYESNLDLTVRMSIAFVLKTIELDSNLSASQFAAVGWGDRLPISPQYSFASEEALFSPRIELRWVRRSNTVER
jgi:flagellar motor protein MotB